MVQAAAVQTPLISGGRESLLLDDEFYDTPMPSSAKAMPSVGAPFTTILTRIQEHRSLEDVQSVLFIIPFL